MRACPSARGLGLRLLAAGLAVTAGLPPAAAVAPLAPPSAVPEPGFSHEDRPPPGVDVRRPVPTDELLRRAGVPRGTSPASAPRADVRRLGTASASGPSYAAAAPPAGRPVNTDLTRHVTPSCNGTGRDGKRVQVVYAHRSDRPSRLSDLAPAIRSWAADVDDALSVSARKTGGERRVRWVASWLPDGGCTPRVTSVAISRAAADDVRAMVSELQAKGLDRADRKYLVFADVSRYCGIAQHFDDSRPDADNWSNGAAPMFARVDSGCWGSPGSRSVAAHEVMHTLGAVNSGAPHHTSAGHCTDGHDLMCYADGSPQTYTTSRCADPDAEHVFDCRDDDYFAVRPAGRYLPTHWNTADSGFLDRRVPRPGLAGTYFDGRDFTGTVVRRRDATVDFGWSGSPVAGIGGDTFSVRWSGKLLAPVAGTYTLYGTSNAGMRIRVDGRLVVDDWSSHTARERASAPLELAAGKHAIEVEFYETTGSATARLAWQGPGIAKQIVPSTRLSTV